MPERVVFGLSGDADSMELVENNEWIKYTGYGLCQDFGWYVISTWHLEPA
jgi:hypothetical protein